jgi:hypothetical protein
VATQKPINYYSRGAGHRTMDLENKINRREALVWPVTGSMRTNKNDYFHIFILLEGGFTKFYPFRFFI